MLYSIRKYPYIQARMSFQAILGEILRPLKRALFKILFRSVGNTNIQSGGASSPPRRFVLQRDVR